jgi:hypothetical protein
MNVGHKGGASRAAGNQGSGGQEQRTDGYAGAFEAKDPRQEGHELWGIVRTGAEKVLEKSATVSLFEAVDS